MSRQLDYSFVGSVIESDQGTALKAAISDAGMIHLACLRHLLVSLKFNEYSFLISKLVKAATQLEIDTVINVLKKQIKAHPQHIQGFQRNLKKVG